MTINQAPEAPKGPKNGVFGARSGVEAGVEGFFNRLVYSRNFALKLSEKGFEHRSER